MERPVRVAFCGTGGIAEAHIKNLRRLQGVDVVALYDADGARARALRERLHAVPDMETQPDPPPSHSRAAQWGIAPPRGITPVVYDDLPTLLREAHPDALYTCLPPFAHGDPELLAAAAGVHLYVEKPQALSLSLAETIGAAIEQAGILATVGYQLRYRPSVQAVRARLSGVPVGMVMGMYLGGLPATPWWRRMDRSGGQLVEQATHTVDMMRYVVGEVESLYAGYALRGLTDVPNLDIPDVTTLSLRFANGAMGTLTATCMLNWAMGAQLNGLHIVARDQLIHLAGNAAVIKQGARTDTIGDDGIDALLEADAAFITAIATGRSDGLLSTYADALRTLAVTLAANESSITQAPVVLPAP